MKKIFWAWHFVYWHSKFKKKNWKTIASNLAVCNYCWTLKSISSVNFEYQRWLFRDFIKTRAFYDEGEPIAKKFHMILVFGTPNLHLNPQKCAPKNYIIRKVLVNYSFIQSIRKMYLILKLFHSRMFKTIHSISQVQILKFESFKIKMHARKVIELYKSKWNKWKERERKKAEEGKNNLERRRGAKWAFCLSLLNEVSLFWADRWGEREKEGEHSRVNLPGVSHASVSAMKTKSVWKHTRVLLLCELSSFKTSALKIAASYSEPHRDQPNACRSLRAHIL